MASLRQHKLSLAKPCKRTLLLPKQHILEVVQKLLNGSDSQLLDPQNKSSPINSTAWPAEAVSRASQPPNDTKEAEACKSLELNFEHFWTPCPPLIKNPYMSQPAASTSSTSQAKGLTHAIGEAPSCPLAQRHLVAVLTPRNKTHKHDEETRPQACANLRATRLPATTLRSLKIYIVSTAATRRSRFSIYSSLDGTQ